MSASLKNINWKAFTKIYGLSGGKSYARLQQYSRTVNREDRDVSGEEQEAEQCRTEENRVPQVGMSQDGQVLIFWHPEPAHPYEHTKPLPPLTQRQLAQEESALKVQLLRNEEMRHRKDGPDIAELSNLFFTTKHCWYPLSARRKALKRKLKPGEEDREGI